jgi:hypothetical protein
VQGCILATRPSVVESLRLLKQPQGFSFALYISG